LGLTDVEGGPAELVMVETPCAAASFAAEESKTSYMIINFLHAFHKLMSNSPAVQRTTTYIHQQCRELQRIFTSSAENYNVYSTADYHKHHKGSISTGTRKSTERKVIF
jgi:hypothetical protein